MSRHDRVQRHLPALATDELSWWRRRLVERHLRRCRECADEAARQAEVEEELARLGTTIAPPDDVAPPPHLLDQLLDQTRDPGLRQRAAVPARGAVSGARPGLSVAFALTALALAAAAVYAGYRLADHLTRDD